MAKQSNQKLKLLYLLKILIENTDENTGLTITQISNELAKYNVSAARKSLYDDLELLRVFGIDIKLLAHYYIGSLLLYLLVYLIFKIISRGIFLS